jgi:hypothetical protein
MATPYSTASIDLGLGGEGNLLSQQVDDEETKRKKKLMQLGGQADTAGAGSNAMGMAAMQLLGSFRG